MDIWIIRDGEKIGPIHDFEIRRKIESGEIDADTSAWHDGLDGWKKLPEIPIFSREFEKLEEKNTPSIEENDTEKPTAASPASPPPVPGVAAYGRRFWARWMDLTLYAGLWWIGLWASRQNVEAAMTSLWIILLLYIPWFIIEAMLIHYTGTTPGKWLMGLRVLNHDGSRLDLGAATRRSMRVMFTGVGFGWGLLAVFCQFLSLITARRLGGVALWDHLGNHRVVVSPLSPLRVALLAFIFITGLYLQAIVLYPYNLKAMNEDPQFQALLKKNPDFKEFFEKSQPWYLPKRH